MSMEFGVYLLAISIGAMDFDAIVISRTIVKCGLAQVRDTAAGPMTEL
jgi:hypothetical protein